MRAPGVDVGAAAQDQVGDHVRRKARERDRQHRSGQDRDRRSQATRGLDDDPDRDHEQAKTVDERCEHAHPAVAIGASLVRRAAAHDHGKERQRERRRVGEHVPGVGQQRKRAAPETSDHLERHEGGRQRERPAQTRAGRTLVIVAGVIGGGHTRSMPPRVRIPRQAQESGAIPPNGPSTSCVSTGPALPPALTDPPGTGIWRRSAIPRRSAAPRDPRASFSSRRPRHRPGTRPASSRGRRYP